MQIYVIRIHRVQENEFKTDRRQVSPGRPKMFNHILYHVCDRVAMLQLEICKFLAGDLVS